MTRLSDDLSASIRKRSDQSDPLAQNLYLYTRNNPVMYADPDGNWFIDAMFLVVDVAQFIEAPSVAGPDRSWGTSPAFPIQRAWLLQQPMQAR